MKWTHTDSFTRRAKWNGHDVIYARGMVLEDFLHGIDMVLQLSPHPLVVVPIGVCTEQLELVTPVPGLYISTYNVSDV